MHDLLPEVTSITVHNFSLMYEYHSCMTNDLNHCPNNFSLSSVTKQLAFTVCHGIAKLAYENEK